MSAPILSWDGLKLRKQLKKLREDRNLKSSDVIAATKISQTSLSRMETGAKPVGPAELHELLNFYKVHGPERQSLETLCVQAFRGGSWSSYSDVYTTSFPALEAGAHAIRTIAWSIPGWAQTPDYARSVLTNIRPELTADEVDRRIEARLTRRETLFGTEREGPAPLTHVLLDESVIRRQVGGPDAMRTQLTELATFAQLGNVTLQVLPFTAGAHAGVEGEFVILQHDDEQIVFTENQLGQAHQDDEDDVQRCNDLFNNATDLAVDPTGTEQLIHQLATTGAPW